jgi:hypothetical protein
VVAGGLFAPERYAMTAYMDTPMWPMCPSLRPHANCPLSRAYADAMLQPGEERFT